MSTCKTRISGVATPDWTVSDGEVALRPLTPFDCGGPYLDWMNDLDSGRFLDAADRHYTSADLAAYVQGVRDRGGFHFGIFDLRFDMHVGNVSTSLVNTRHCYAEIGIVIGSGQRERGYGSRGLGLFLDYLFGVQELHRVQLGVSEKNTPAIKLYERLGFQREGYCREQYLDRETGDFSGTISYAILREEWLSDRAESET
jgi:RimJ/RimL family protein N-acetyltransferase